MTFDFGARVVEVLEVVSTPTTAPVPLVKPQESAIHIGPSLIVRGQRVIVTILVDGRSPTLSCTFPLKSIKLSQLVEEDRDLGLSLAGPQSAAAIGVVAGLAAYMLQQFSPHPVNLVAGWLGIFLLSAATLCQVWMM